MNARRPLAAGHLALATAAALTGGLRGAPLHLLPGHGVIMVVFAALPALLGAIGQRLMPPMLGASGMAMPRLGFAALCLLFGGFGLLALGRSEPALALGASGLLLMACDGVATILNMRAPGHRLHDLPPPVWGHLAGCVLLVFSLPVLAGLATRLPQLGLGTLASVQDEHLFWLAAQPLLLVMLVASLGLAGGIVEHLAGRRLAGGLLAPYALVMLATGGFMLWAHHLFVAGPAVGNTAYLAASAFLLVPVLGVLIGSWLVTLVRLPGLRWQDPALLWIMGFVALCCAGAGGGAVTALRCLTAPSAVPPLDGLARFHLLLASCAICAFFGGYALWVARMPVSLARLQATTMLGGMVMVFLPDAGLTGVGVASCAFSVLIFGGALVMSWRDAAWRAPEMAPAMFPASQETTYRKPGPAASSRPRPGTMT